MKKLAKSMLICLVMLCSYLMAAIPISASTGSAAVIGLHPSSIGCPPNASQPALSNEYKTSVTEAIYAPQDIWGQQVLSKSEGPTYNNVKDYLSPIMYAIAPAASGGFLSDTGVYYIPFGQPQQPTSPGDLALTVADGSQIISNKVGSLSTRIFVGAGGQEQFGSCLTNLSTPELYKGYLPILELQYKDYNGNQYHQESFATNLPGTDMLASYVEITPDKRKSNNSGITSTNIRFHVCDSCNLHQEDNRLVDDQGRTYLYFSHGATFNNSDLVYNLDSENNSNDSVYMVRLVTPSSNTPAIHADKGGQEKARLNAAAYWDNRLSEGGTFQVPEDKVMDAQRNLLIQDLLMTWRYSLGNAYEAFYQPESSTTMEVLSRYGFTQVYKQALQDLLPKSKGSDRRNWEIGEKLIHAADYYRLTGDSSLITSNLATYEGYAADLAAQHAADPNHLLARQQYSSDVKGMVYGLHQIATALLGLRDMVSVWQQLGYSDLVSKYAPIADELGTTFDHAVKASVTVMPDGSLFTPVMLLDKEAPYDNLTTSNLGSYWNLVAQYGFAAQVYGPGSTEAKAALQYLYNHGSRMLGLLRVRDGALDDVYGVDQSKFLADNDQPDQLVLSLYSDLAHGMTQNTFISGEAENVGPLTSKWPLQFGACQIGAPCTPPSFENGWSSNEYYRGMYLSPNSANNGLFLNLLRLTLINEVTNNKGEPQSLQLAFSTPRGWLEEGKKIQVNEAPTLFGPISYTITSKIDHNNVMADLEIPSKSSVGNIQLRLRVPAGKQLIGVNVNGKPYDKFNPSTETIDLTGLSGKLIIRADYR